MTTTLDRKNRQKSGYSFPRPTRKTVAGKGAGQRPPVPVADPFDRQGAQAGYARELGQVRPPFSFTLGGQQGISAAYAARDAAQEARRAQQTREGIGQMYDVMDRLDATPGSQKLAAIAGASPGELTTQERDVQLALRTQNPMQSTEIIPEDYAARIGQEYALDPETGRALKTFYEPSDKSPEAVAERKTLRDAYQDQRKKEKEERQARLAFNAMAGTPAGQRAIFMEQMDRAAQTETRGLLTDLGVAVAGRQPAMDASGNVIPSGVDPTTQTLMQYLAGGAAPVPGASLGGRGVPFGPLDFGEPTAVVIDKTRVDELVDDHPGDREGFVRAYVADGGDVERGEAIADDEYGRSSLTGPRGLPSPMPFWELAAGEFNRGAGIEPPLPQGANVAVGRNVLAAAARGDPKAVLIVEQAKRAQRAMRGRLQFRSQESR